MRDCTVGDCATADDARFVRRHWEARALRSLGAAPAVSTLSSFESWARATWSCGSRRRAYSRLRSGRLGWRVSKAVGALGSALVSHGARAGALRPPSTRATIFDRLRRASCADATRAHLAAIWCFCIVRIIPRAVSRRLDPKLMRHQRDPRQGPLRPRALDAAWPPSSTPTACPSPTATTRPSGCSRAPSSAPRRRSRSRSPACSGTAGPTRSPTTSTSSPTPTASSRSCRSSGERPAAERLRALLARAYGDAWSPALLERLLAEAGSPGKTLEAWLRDDFFAQHTKLFAQRPFIWHVWDGRKDGFSVLCHYHRLDRARLERLTYTLLGDWIERQRAAGEEPGAEARLSAALGLQEQLAADHRGRGALRHLRPLEDPRRAAARLGARPRRRRPAQHPAVRDRGRPARQGQRQVGQGPRQEPRRLRAHQRPPPDPRPEAGGAGEAGEG